MSSACWRVRPSASRRSGRDAPAQIRSRWIIAMAPHREQMGISISSVRLKPERLPEPRRTIVSRMNGDDGAAGTRMVEQSQSKHPAEPALTHCGTNVETPHPQRRWHSGIDGHAADADERIIDIGAKQPFAVMFKPVIADRPMVDKTGDMAIALPPGLAFEICHLLRQPIAEPADINCHGNADGFRLQERESRGAASQPAGRPARNSRHHRLPCRAPYVSPAPLSPR